ncbi:hypothetical protein DESAMIL20_1204 [Desulfurella amilsii]|uniref:Uncharacterized protein n=1 Tax=Desulfurella amilsii TaxID=1562698 RepID=A0A1X4XVU6_9BACT|nr:hypothetical protein [Desulfurella amilsii]OSS41651.1 hypothetical protein DESAMIL20_1204 [Desulfurella amilsii]
MTSVSLPDLPKGKEFEEYISAFFQLMGNYIERNIIEREVEEILELDIVATDYRSSPPEIKLLEVKSGEWGFPDLFKVRGWMDYLNISKWVFVASKEKDKIDFFKEKAKRLNIDLVVIPNIKDVDISVWRFSYWVERNLLKHLNHKKKSQPDKKCFRALEDYYFKVNSEIFFTESIIQKVHTLYSIFQEFPRISAKCGNELIGNTFDKEYYDLPKKIYEDTYYECSYNDIQISTFIEHRARLAILKSAIDYRLDKDAGIKDKTKNLKISDDIILKDLPQSFKEGLDVIFKDKYFHKYPLFWQWFMWLFGGFILKDYEEKEYEVLSQKTGIPIEEIPNALKAYQILFPRDGGWFMDLPSSNIKLMKMFPVPFMGIGANYRRLLYTESGKFEDLNLTGMYTLNDLIKWNNLTVEVLRGKRDYLPFSRSTL